MVFQMFEISETFIKQFKFIAGFVIRTTRKFKRNVGRGF